jgi:hypothetical protein
MALALTDIGLMSLKKVTKTGRSFQEDNTAPGFDNQQ